MNSTGMTASTAGCEAAVPARVMLPMVPSKKMPARVRRPERRASTSSRAVKTGTSCWAAGMPALEPMTGAWGMSANSGTRSARVCAWVQHWQRSSYSPRVRRPSLSASPRADIASVRSASERRMCSGWEGWKALLIGEMLLTVHRESNGPIIAP